MSKNNFPTYYPNDALIDLGMPKKSQYGYNFVSFIRDNNQLDKDNRRITILSKDFQDALKTSKKKVTMFEIPKLVAASNERTNGSSTRRKSKTSRRSRRSRK